MADFWAKEEVIAVVDKNDRGEQVQIKKCERAGKEYIDVRTFYMKGSELAPGKGIAIPIELATDVANAILSGVTA